MKIQANNFKGFLPASKQAYKIGTKSIPDAVIVTMYLKEDGDYMTDEVFVEYINETQDFKTAYKEVLKQVELSYGVKLINTKN